MTVAVPDVQLNNGVAWSPLGQGHALTHPVVELAERHGRTPAQVVLRWRVLAGLDTGTRLGPDPDERDTRPRTGFSNVGGRWLPAGG
jgi:hypothetical protein